MKPILFDKSATTFTTNGLGRLNFIKCTVTEERNGQYILEGTIAEEELHASSLEMGSIIVAKPNQTSALQAFRVHKLVKPINGIYELAAQHISYQLSFIPTMPFSVTAASTACNSTLQALKSNAAESCPFTFWTNVTTVSSYKQTAPASIRSRLGGVEGSVLDQFGGEYEWDNYTVKLHSARGVQTPSVTLRYGKNITDLNQEEEINNVITGVCPYWMDSEGGNVVTLPEKTVDSSTASSYPFKRTVPLDLSSDWEEAPTQAQLRARAQAYVNSSGIGIPKVNIKVSFVNLSDTEEYKDIAALQTVSLCDYVTVQFEKLGINTQAKVVKTVYNVLLERYDSIEVGSLRSSLAGTISDQSAEIAAVADTTREMFKSYDATVQEDIDNATAWLTSSNGYVMARKDAYGNWKELFFMDTADASTAHNVLRINENGIGFSSNGVSGPYTQAWTLDGKLVIGGTNVPSFTVYDSSNNIIFQTSRSGTVWNSTNSSMSADGTISATSAVLASCTITNGSLTIKSGNTTIFSVSSSGITWNLPNSSMTSSGTLTASNANINGVLTSAGSSTTCKVQNGHIDFFLNSDLNNRKSYIDANDPNNPSALLIRTPTNNGISITNNVNSSYHYADISLGYSSAGYLSLEGKDGIDVESGTFLNLTSKNDMALNSGSGDLGITTNNFQINADDDAGLYTNGDIVINSTNGQMNIWTDGGTLTLESSGDATFRSNWGDVAIDADGNIYLNAVGHIYANGRQLD